MGNGILGALIRGMFPSLFVFVEYNDARVKGFWCGPMDGEGWNPFSQDALILGSPQKETLMIGKWKRLIDFFLHSVQNL